MAIIISEGQVSRIARAFDERTTLTFLNAAQMLAIGALGLCIITLKLPGGRRQYTAQLYWLFVFVGSLVLAFDELNQIHEKLGKLQSFAYLAVQLNPIDLAGEDLVLVGYALAGITIAWLFRGEAFSHRPAVAWFMVGCACLAGSLLIDVLPFSRLPGHSQVPVWVVVEETLKIFGFGALLGGAYLRYQAETDALLRRVHQSPASSA